MLRKNNPYLDKNLIPGLRSSTFRTFKISNFLGFRRIPHIDNGLDQTRSLNNSRGKTTKQNHSKTPPKPKFKKEQRINTYLCRTSSMRKYQVLSNGQSLLTFSAHRGRVDCGSVAFGHACSPRVCNFNQTMLIKRIKAIACERHSNTAIHPRPALFHIRTIEIFRSLGMMEMILEESGK